MDLSRPHPMARAITDAITPSNRTDRTVTVEDMSFDLRYAPEPGVDLRIRGSGAGEQGTVVATTFDAAFDRPPAYPPELPYLPGVKVSLMDLPERAGASATWWMVADVESALAGILAQSEAAGWAPADGADEGTIAHGVRMIALARPGRGRTIIVASAGADSMITVMDRAEGE
jgi:hypothetical protein